MLLLLIHFHISEQHVDPSIDSGFAKLRNTIDYYISRSGYAVVNLTTLYKGFNILSRETVEASYADEYVYEEDDEDEI